MFRLRYSIVTHFLFSFLRMFIFEEFLEWIALIHFSQFSLPSFFQFYFNTFRYKSKSILEYFEQRDQYDGIIYIYRWNAESKYSISTQVFSLNVDYLLRANTRQLQMISLLFHSELCSLDDHCGPPSQLSRSLLGS